MGYQIFYQIINIILTILAFTIPESPKFVFEKKDYNRVRKILAYVAKFNRVKFDQDFKFIPEIKEENKPRLIKIDFE